MSDAPVDVVIVTYNCRELVSGAIESTKCCFDAGLVGRCIVVDNDSGDRTVEFVRNEHPFCTVVANTTNVGFGRACNIGIERACAPYVLLLNPDAALAPSALVRLVSLLDRTPRAGAAAPAIRQTDGRWQPAGGLLTPRDLLLQALGHRGAFPDRRTILPGQQPFRTSWLCGAVVLMRKSMLDDLGGFDPRYFLYFEETDLWRRARLAGWELWAVGEAVASHVQAGSAKKEGRRMYAGCIAEYYFRSRFRYLTVHFGRPAAIAAELSELGLLTVRAATRILRGRDIEDFRTRVTAPVLGYGATKVH